LGNWIHSAKSFATNESESNLYEFNARNQITLWGPDGEIEDYAAKAWGGLYSYYLQRWSFFIDSLVYSLSNNQPFDKNNYESDLLIQAHQWCQSISPFPTVASGDSIVIANSLLFKYANSDSIASTYTVQANTDAPGNDLIQAWTTDIEQLKILCYLDPECLGFNSNGYLKFAVNQTVSSPATLYVKNTV